MSATELYKTPHPRAALDEAHIGDIAARSAPFGTATSHHAVPNSAVSRMPEQLPPASATTSAARRACALPSH
jgi:hypothetical protein